MIADDPARPPPAVIRYEVESRFKNRDAPGEVDKHIFDLTPLPAAPGVLRADVRVLHVSRFVSGNAAWLGVATLRVRFVEADQSAAIENWEEVGPAVSESFQTFAASQPSPDAFAQALLSKPEALREWSAFTVARLIGGVSALSVSTPVRAGPVPLLKRPNTVAEQDRSMAVFALEPRTCTASVERVTTTRYRVTPSMRVVPTPSTLRSVAQVSTVDGWPLSATDTTDDESVRKAGGEPLTVQVRRLSPAPPCRWRQTGGQSAPAPAPDD